jgi:TPR repeat protein
MTTVKTFCGMIVPIFLVSLAWHSGAKAEGTPTATDLTALQVAATTGDAQAELQYGIALSHSGNSNKEEARLWIQKAANQGLAEAWFWLGYSGVGKEPSLVYYERSAEMGYTRAFEYIFDDLLFRAGPNADVVTAKKFGDLARSEHADLGYDTRPELLTIDRCFEAGVPNLPEVDRPAPRASAENAGADCSDFGPDTSTPPRWKRYRECLLSEKHFDNNLVAEIYANGWGVKRDPKLATALVCHASEVPAELIAMVEALTTSRGKSSDRPFRFCDNITSGLSGAACADRAEHIAEKHRSQKINALILSWSPSQRLAFDALQAAASKYYDEHAGSEQDMSGTARDQFYIDEVARLKAKFLKDVEAFEGGRLPPHESFPIVDRRLNATYRKLLGLKDWTDAGTINAGGIRATQRLWLAYRDAWAKFGVERYPRTSAADWKAWVTERRTRELEAIDSEVGAIQPL